MSKELLFLILFFSTTAFVFSQSWKDSLYYGNQQYKKGNFHDSYRTLLEAQKIAPKGVDLSKDIGNAAYRNQDYEMAEKAFRSAAINDSIDSRKSQNWYNAGNSQMQSKKYQDAIESYKNTLRIDPNNNEARYNLAKAQSILKQQNQQNKNQPKDNQSDNKPDDKNQKLKDEKGDNQRPNDKKHKSSDKPDSKLTDRKTDRMLEDLLKEEIQTKRKVREMNSDKYQQQEKSGKQW